MARVRWWGTGSVLLVLLLFGVGLPVVDRALGSGRSPLAAGTVVAVGSEEDGVRPVTFTVPAAGWMLDEANTSLTNNAQLSSHDVVFNLSVVVPLGSVDPWRLWRGFGRIVAMNGATRLPPDPSAVTTAQGLTGLTAAITGHRRTGMASVFARDTLGATVTASGPPDAYRRLAGQVEAMVRSIGFAP